MEPTAHGVLSKTPLAHLVVYCVDRKLRGTLILRPADDDDPAAADVITLVDGHPAKVRVADPVQHLGRIMLEIGVIDEAAYNESLRALGRGDGLQGQILMRMGMVDARSLERSMRIQIARKLGHLFERPKTTRYAFYDGADFLAKYGGPELYLVDPSPVVFTAVRSSASMEHADATVDRLANTPIQFRAAADLSRLDISRVERELLDLLPLTPNQLAEAGACDPRSTRLLVYGLLLLKQVEPVPRAAAAATTPASGGPPQRTSVPFGFAGRPSSPSFTSAPEVPAPPRSPIVVSAAPMAASTPSISSISGGPPSRPGPLIVDSRVGPLPGSRRAEIQARAAAIANENYFQILGVTPETSADDLKAAYFQLAKKWHPDRLAPDLADNHDAKQDVARVFAHMTEAYQTLTDPEGRGRYLQLIAQGGGTPKDQAEVARIMEASTAFMKAEFFVAKGALNDAEPFAKKAVELEPTDPDHIAVWCWVQGHKPERREGAHYDDLITKLSQVLADSPRNERARYYRGMLHKFAGHALESIRDFQSVAEHNPKHTEAVREVRLHTMRQEHEKQAKAESSTSLLGRFLKKK